MNCSQPLKWFLVNGTTWTEDVDYPTEQDKKYLIYKSGENEYTNAADAEYTMVKKRIKQKHGYLF